MITTLENSNRALSKDIIKCLNVLYSTPAGSVAGDRAFGIDMSLQDKPFSMAKTLLIAEFIEKTKRYEKRVTVEGVIITTDGAGILTCKVVLR